MNTTMSQKDITELNKDLLELRNRVDYFIRKYSKVWDVSEKEQDDFKNGIIRWEEIQKGNDYYQIEILCNM